MSWTPGQQPHQARAAAESFGEDPERYHRSRPRYPEAFYDRLLDEAPGNRVLDVGAGTGIVAGALAERGATVVGVEVDARMAQFAREQYGLTVDVGRFEEWDPAGRVFDAVLAGTAWHWVDPGEGSNRAAEILVDGGLIALFWNARDLDPTVAAAFADLYARETPDAPFGRGVAAGTAAYDGLLSAAADGLERSGAFGPPEHWRTDWTIPTSRGQWLDQLGSFGGHNLIPPDAFTRLSDGMGAVIDDAGGSIDVNYATVAVIARRLSRAAG